MPAFMFLTGCRLRALGRPFDRLTGADTGISRPATGVFEQRAVPGRHEPRIVAEAREEETLPRASADNGFLRAVRPMPPPAVDDRESVKSLA